MKPVYVINGFLESGKTEFISFTLAQPYFQIKGKTKAEVNKSETKKQEI